eukprot:Nk52_evm9s348 gene=Nk52_evmTU9s348
MGSLGPSSSFEQAQVAEELNEAIAFLSDKEETISIPATVVDIPSDAPNQTHNERPLSSATKRATSPSRSSTPRPPPPPNVVVGDRQRASSSTGGRSPLSVRGSQPSCGDGAGAITKNMNLSCTSSISSGSRRNTHGSYNFSQENITSPGRGGRLSDGNATSFYINNNNNTSADKQNKRGEEGVEGEYGYGCWSFLLALAGAGTSSEGNGNPSSEEADVGQGKSSVEGNGPTNSHNFVEGNGNNGNDNNNTQRVSSWFAKHSYFAFLGLIVIIVVALWLVGVYLYVAGMQDEEENKVHSFHDRASSYITDLATELSHCEDVVRLVSAHYTVHLGSTWYTPEFSQNMMFGRQVHIDIMSQLVGRFIGARRLEFAWAPLITPSTRSVFESQAASQWGSSSLTIKDMSPTTQSFVATPTNTTGREVYFPWYVSAITEPSSVFPNTEWPSQSSSLLSNDALLWDIYYGPGGANDSREKDAITRSVFYRSPVVSPTRINISSTFDNSNTTGYGSLRCENVKLYTPSFNYTARKNSSMSLRPLLDQLIAEQANQTAFAGMHPYAKGDLTGVLGVSVGLVNLRSLVEQVLTSHIDNQNLYDWREPNGYQVYLINFTSPTPWIDQGDASAIFASARYVFNASANSHQWTLVDTHNPIHCTYGLCSLCTGNSPVTKSANEQLVSYSDTHLSRIVLFGGIPVCILVAIDDDFVQASETDGLWKLIALFVVGCLNALVLMSLRVQAVRLSRLKDTFQRGEVARKQAEESNKIKRSFLSYVFHEVRVPFNSLFIGVEWLLSEEEDHESDRYTCLNTIYASTQQVLHILNDVLDMAKIEEGKMELKRDYFSLDQLMNNAFNNFVGPAQSKHISLNCEWDPNGIRDLYVFGDMSRLGQCINNLVSNALKFTPDGGVVSIKCSFKETIAIPLIRRLAENEDKDRQGGERKVSLAKKVSNEYTDVSAQLSLTSQNEQNSRGDVHYLSPRGKSKVAPSEPYEGEDKNENAQQTQQQLLTTDVEEEEEKKMIQLTLAVKDNGIGLSDENKAKLFQPYVQVLNKDTQKAGVGTGLGLCIVKMIIEEHDGIIYVESDGINGSEFIIELPIKCKRVKDKAAPLSMNPPLQTSTKAGSEGMLVRGQSMLMNVDKLGVNSSSFLTIASGKSGGSSVRPDGSLTKSQRGSNSTMYTDAVTNLSRTTYSSSAYPSTTTMSYANAGGTKSSSGRIFPDEEVSEASASIAGGSSATTGKRWQDMRFLVVEDNAPTRKMMELLLRGLDCRRVVFAENGQEAVDILLQQGPKYSLEAIDAAFKRGVSDGELTEENGDQIPLTKDEAIRLNAIRDGFDMVLMDNQMPIMNGPEACMCIRQAKCTVPIVACTANVLAEDKKMFLDCGVNGFLSKPVRKADLMKIFIDSWDGKKFKPVF